MCLSEDYPIETENLPKSIIGYKVVKVLDGDLINLFDATTKRPFHYKVGKTHRTTRKPGFSVFEKMGPAVILSRKLFIPYITMKVIKVKLSEIERKGIWPFSFIIYPHDPYMMEPTIYEGRTLKVLEVLDTEPREFTEGGEENGKKSEG